MDKKGSATLIGIIIVLALAILIMALVNVSGRECSNNSECSAGSYCGADYSCHTYPDNIVVKENNFVSAALILGIALIVAAYIFRNGKKKE
jgi:hypothetical protein